LWDVADASLLSTITQRESGATRVTFMGDTAHLAVGWDTGRVEVIDLVYFDRYLAGNEPYQRARIGLPATQPPR
jgi:hypothetical protein